MKHRKQVTRSRARVTAASIALDLDLLLGGDDPLTVQMADRGGKAVPQIKISAYSGGTIRQWWSDTPLVINLAGMKLPAKQNRLVLLRDHDMGRPLGNATKITKTDKDLSLEGECTVPGDDAEQFIEASKNGFPWRASIGAGSLKVAYVQAGEKLVANGRTFDGPLTHVVECELREVSVVTMGADDETDSVAASDQEKEDIMKRIRATASGRIAAAAQGQPAGEPGAQPSTATPLAAAAAAAPTPVVVAGAPDFTAQRAAQAAELERCNGIQAIAGIGALKSPDGKITLAAHAITEGWSKDRTELEVLRASRSPAPNVLVPSQPELTHSVLAAAVCQAGNLTSLDRHFSAQTLEAAQTAFRGRIGLQQLLVLAAQRNGYNGSPFLRSPGDIADVLRCAFSTGTLAGVLSAAGNKMLLEAFNHVEQSWRKIAKINANVQDFKEYNTYAYTGDSVFEKIAKDAEIPHGTLSDEKYGNKIETYAKMLGITRQDIINDDLGILDSRAAKHGRGAGLAFNIAFWTEFLADNATFFTAARGNYISGATTTLTSVGLTAALLKFRKMVGSDGKVLGATPKFLVVPPDLEVDAEELMASVNLNSGGAAATVKIPNRNVFAGKYEVVPSAYLSDATIPGYSATAWWLAADPLDLPVIEAGFLRGAVAPTVEEVAVDPHHLGIELRGFFDFGVRKQVYQAAVKSKGAA